MAGSDVNIAVNIERVVGRRLANGYPGVVGIGYQRVNRSSGTINGQTISSAANFTGTVDVQGAGGLTLGVASTTAGSLNFANATSSRLTILQGANPSGTGNATITLPSIAGGSSDTVCLVNLGNCAGSGTGVTTPGGTIGTIPVFSGSQSLADSVITQSGSAITITGTLNVTDASALTLGTGSSSDGAIVFNNGTNNNTFTLQSGVSGSNLTFTLPTADGSAGDCLKTNASGVLSFQGCTAGGGGVTTIDGQSGVVTINNSSGAGGAISIDNAKADGSTKGIATFNSTNFSDNGSGVINTIQDIATTSSPQFANVTVGAPASSVGYLKLANATSSRLVLLQGLNPSGAGNATIQIPTIAGGSTDTVCLLTLANCSASGTAGGDLTGTYPNPTIASLQGTTLTLSSLASGDVLQYNGSAIVNGHITNSNLTAGSFTNIQGTGALNAGSITSGFGAIDVGADNISTTGTVNGNTIDRTTSGTLTIGGTATGITIGDTTNNAAVLIQGKASSTFTIGNTNTTGTTTIGQSTASNTINIGNADTADTKTQTINIGAGNGVTTGKSVVTIGSTANASSTTVQGGSAGVTIINGSTNIGPSELNLLDGKDAALVDVNDAVTTAITGTGTLTSGAIGSGFGNISTGNTITTTGTVGTAATTTFTGAGATFSGTVNLGTVGAGTAASTVHIADTSDGTGTQTVTIGSAAKAADIVTIQGGSSGGVNIVNGSTTIGFAELNLLDGHDVALVDVNDAVNTLIIGTGALDSGSITSNFGAIDTGADNITTTGTVNGDTIDRSTAGALTIGSTATSIVLNKNTSVAGSGTFDTGSGAVGLNGDVTVASGKNFTQSGGGTFSTGTGTVSLQGTTTVAANKNFALASGTGTFAQTYTGTTTDAHSITANSLQTGSAFKVTSSNNSGADSAWSAISLNVTNAQDTTAVSTGQIAGLDLQFTQNPAIAGNTEYVANLAIAQNNSSATDASVSAILNLSNNDTATGNQITAAKGLQVNGGNVTDGIYLNGTFGTNLINTSTGNFVVTQAGAITGASLNTGSGSIVTTGTVGSAGNTTFTGAGATFTGTVNINNATPLVTNQTGAIAVFNTNATTVNAFGAASTINLGASGATVAGAGDLTIQQASGSTLNLGNTGSSSAVSIRCGASAAACGFGDNSTDHTTALGSNTGTSATNIQSGSGGISLAGNTTVSGTNTFTTGTGNVTLKGNVSIDANKTFLQNGSGTFGTGSGAVSLNGDTTVASGKSFTFNGETFTDLTGNGLTLSTGALTVQVAASADALSATTSSGSGLEVLSSGVALLQGCNNGQILKWNEASDVWECSADNSGSGSQTLQDTYDASSTPALITLASGKNIEIDSPDVATDPNIVFDLQCATCSAGGGQFQVANAGTTVLSVKNNSSSTAAVIIQPKTNSTRGFEIQNAAGTSNLFIADTTNTRIGIGLTGPAYTLDVAGDANITGAYRIGGTSTLSSTALTFVGASTATIQPASSQALTITAHGTSTWSTDSGNLTLDAAGALNLGTANSTSTSLGKSGTTLTINPTSITATPTISGLITATSGVTSNGAVTVQNNSNLAISSGTGTFAQTYTGTTTNASTTTANSLTSGNAQKIAFKQNDSAAAGTTASGLNIAAADATNSGNTTDLINLSAAGSTGTVNGIEFTGTDTNFDNLLKATNFSVTSAGALTAVGLNSGSGLIQGTGGMTVAGTAQINVSGTANTTIGNSAGGTITLGASSGSDLILQDANWGVTGAGAATFASITNNGTYNGNTFTSTRLAFSAASTGTVDSASGRALALGDTNATGVTIGNTSNTASFQVQGTAAATYTIGDTNTTGNITLGRSTDTNTIAIGNAAVADTKTQTINIGNGNAVGGTSGGVVVNIAAGTPGTSASNQVAIGTTTGASSTTAIKGGTGASALTAQVGASGTISIGTTNQTSTQNIGNTSASTVTLINGGTGSTAIQLQAGSGGTIGIANNAVSQNVTIGNTTGGTITIGGASGSNLILQDADWNISGAGAITATSLNAGSGAITTSGNISTTGSGTITSAGLLTGSAGLTISGGDTSITRASTTAFTVAEAASTYGLQVDTSVASAITGLKITARASGNGVNLDTISNGSTNEAIIINAKGSGNVNIANTSTGNVNLAGGSGTTGCTVTNSNGNLACDGTYNTNTFTGSALTFGTAGTATIQPASGQALTVTAHAASTWSTDSGNLSLDAASALNLGTTNATSVVIGNTANTTSFQVQGTAAATYTIGDTNTTGTITLGRSTDSNTISIGSGVQADNKTQTVNIANGAANGTTSGGNTVNIAATDPSNANGVNAVNIGNSGVGAANIAIRGGTSGTIGIGSSAGTGTITLGSSSGAQTVNISNGAGAGTVAIANVQNGGSVAVGAGMTTGTITVGGASQTGTITVGQSTQTQTISIAAAQTADTKINTINIGTSATATGKAVITIGNTNGASSLTLNAGSAGISLAADTTVADNKDLILGTTTGGSETATDGAIYYDTNGVSNNSVNPGAGFYGYGSVNGNSAAWYPLVNYADVQCYYGSGTHAGCTVGTGAQTWNKPIGVTSVMAILCGGGGGGGSGAEAGANTRSGGSGGGGGACVQRVFAAGDVSGGSVVSIGTGGNGGSSTTTTGNTTGGDGTAGGNTTFNTSQLIAGGGGFGLAGQGGGNNSAGGAGGGAGSVGSNGTTSANGAVGGGAGAIPSGTLSTTFGAGSGGAGGGAVPNDVGHAAEYGGGGGGGANQNGAGTAGGTSMYGGGGGGGGGEGGTSAAAGADGGNVQTVDDTNGGGGGANGAAGATATAGTAGNSTKGGAGGGGGAGTTSTATEGGDGGAGGICGGGGGGGGAGHTGGASNPGEGGAGGDGCAWIISW